MNKPDDSPPSWVLAYLVPTLIVLLLGYCVYHYLIHFCDLMGVPR